MADGHGFHVASGDTPGLRGLTERHFKSSHLSRRPYSIRGSRHRLSSRSASSVGPGILRVGATLVTVCETHVEGSSRESPLAGNLPYIHAVVKEPPGGIPSSGTPKRAMKNNTWRGWAAQIWVPELGDIWSVRVYADVYPDSPVCRTILCGSHTDPGWFPKDTVLKPSAPNPKDRTL